ncbi:MAG: hypothetical protein GX665_03030 [Gammaproteobacteria bacterium]|nr:hypothetical protein [Gammaproteobacteria bacterium]
MSVLDDVVESYFRLLDMLDWNDENVLIGLREGLNKFPSNLFLKLSGKNKYFLGDYYSADALEKINKRDFSGLIFEHMVPKQQYIQTPCEELARTGRLNEESVRAFFVKYWKIAVITSSENKLLIGHSMPADWDGVDIKCRYKKASIELYAHDEKLFVDKK